MAELFVTGHVVDLILVLMVLEGVVLIRWARRNGRSELAAGLLGNMLAGAGLLLALRGALAGAWWGWIALCLALALLAHVADLSQRCGIFRPVRSP